MSIEVLCQGCKTRFQVSDKFAGQKGPCPKCKAIIQIPAKVAEVVVHAPEVSGPKDSQGRSVLKPLSRSEATVTPVRIGVAVGVVVLVLAAAMYLRFAHPQDPKGPATFPIWPLIVGSLLIAPLTSWSGYSFLRDDELEPLRGRSLLLRVAICSVAYAALWAAYYAIKLYLLAGKPPETFELVYVIPPLVAIGAAVAWSCFDLSYGTGIVHVGFYLFVTVVLRLVVGLRFL